MEAGIERWREWQHGWDFSDEDQYICHPKDCLACRLPLQARQSLPRIFGCSAPVKSAGNPHRVHHGHH